jgi:hypothetical protein
MHACLYSDITVYFLCTVITKQNSYCILKTARYDAKTKISMNPKLYNYGNISE